MPDTIGYIEILGLPPIAAWLTVDGETLGGAALLLGVYARLTGPAALPLLVGTVWVQFIYGWLFSLNGGGWEFPLVLVIMACGLTRRNARPLSAKSLPVFDAILPKFLKV